MSDIVERLRAEIERTVELDLLHQVAADEIEQWRTDYDRATATMQAEIERLRAQVAELEKDKAVWIKRADKTWHERNAVLTEREACARICEGTFAINVVLDDEEAYYGRQMAAAIRARKP